MIANLFVLIDFRSLSTITHDYFFSALSLGVGVLNDNEEVKGVGGDHDLVLLGANPKEHELVRGVNVTHDTNRERK